MKKITSYCLVLVLVFMFGGCAQSYYELNPNKMNYISKSNSDEIQLEYCYDVLRLRGNKKMAKKEQTKNIRVVAVKITNNTDRVINIGNNAAFFNDNSMILPMDPAWLKTELRQSVPSYLFYLLFTPLNLYVNGSDGIPIGLVLGPALTIGNMAVAAVATKSFHKELQLYNIMYRDILPGETVFGIMGFKNYTYPPLALKFIR